MSLDGAGNKLIGIWRRSSCNNILALLLSTTYFLGLPPFLISLHCCCCPPLRLLLTLFTTILDFRMLTDGRAPAFFAVVFPLIVNAHLFVFLKKKKKNIRVSSRSFFLGFYRRQQDLLIALL